MAWCISTGSRNRADKNKSAGRDFNSWEVCWLWVKLFGLTFHHCELEIKRLLLRDTIEGRENDPIICDVTLASTPYENRCIQSSLPYPPNTYLPQ
eukprot:scaffold25560_cov60-Attheya_sp.AAC.2